MKIFIGHDSTQQVNTDACLRSLEIYGDYGLDINLIDLQEVRKLGYDRIEDGSTEFAYTRFLVPYLCDYKGYALFCDSDFIWRSHPHYVLGFVDHDPVTCVKHPRMETKGTTKFKGNKNEWYPKKWWSSLMLFDCSHPDIVNNLTLENVNTQTSQWLHRMEWASSIGELPKEFNHLIRYYDYDPNAVAVHFTEGSPMYSEYEKDDYADEWRKFAEF